MSKFMKDNIPAVGRVGGTGLRRIPGDDHRPHPAAGLAQAGRGSLLPNVLVNRTPLIHHVHGRVDKDCEQLRKIVGLTVQ